MNEILARVAYAAGRTETATASLNEYLVAAGREGDFYREALELLDSAEVRLEREAAERRRAPAPRRSGTATRRPLAPRPRVSRLREMVVLPGSTVALGRYELTLGEYRAATGGGAGGGCRSSSDGDHSWRNPSFSRRPIARDVHELGRRSGVCVLAEPDDAGPRTACRLWRNWRVRPRALSLDAIGTVQGREGTCPAAPTAPTTWVSRTCSGTWWSGRRAAWTATAAAASCTAATGTARPSSSFRTRVATDAPPFAKDLAGFRVARTLE